MLNTLKNPKSTHNYKLSVLETKDSYYLDQILSTRFVAERNIFAILEPQNPPIVDFYEPQKYAIHEL